MAPKRRAPASRVASMPTRQQSRITFNGKSGAITKSGAKSDSKATKKDPTLLEDIVRTQIKAEAEPNAEESTTAEKAIIAQTRKEVSGLREVAQQDPLAEVEQKIKTEDVLGGRASESTLGAVGGSLGSGWVGDEETRALKISDAQIKRYWREKEAKRLAPRVHQEDLSVYEKVLREWDMSGQYGPCIGIARLKRWKRANLLGLQPPIEILSILLKELQKGDAHYQRAHVDELLSSRFIET